MSPEHYRVLTNSIKADRFVPASSLTKGTKLRAPDVAYLFQEGLLDHRLGKYKYNSRTIAFLQEQGFDTDQIPRDDKPKKVTAPRSKQKKAIVKELDLSSDHAEILSSVKGRQAIQYALALKKLQAGDPFPMIRLQWPELVIHDPLQLKYFEKYCDRTDNLDLRLDDRQVDLILHSFDKGIQQIGIKGSTSPGKGFATAITINLYYTCFPDSRIVLIGPSVAHSKNVMFAEVATWRKRMKFPGPGEILTQAIKDPGDEKHVLYIANPDTGEGLSGAHGAHVLFVFDEASSVDESLFVNSQKQAALIIAISNPRVLSGWFYDLFPKATPNDNQTITDKGFRRRLITFGGKDCINVKGRRLHIPQAPEGGLEIETIDGQKHTVYEFQDIPTELRPHVDALIPGQMDFRKYSQIMSKPDEIERAWSGEGHFPPEDAELQIIPPSWLKEPCRLWTEKHDSIHVTAFGLDLAASTDGDQTVLASGGPEGIKALYRTRKAGLMETLSWLKGVFSKIGIDPFEDYYPIAVDCIGAGGDRIADLLEENGASVVRNKGSVGANDKALYGNRRAELYGQLSSRLNPDADHLDVFMMPDDSKLKEELVAHEKVYLQDMIKFRLTPKKKLLTGADSKIQSLQEILGRSPDSSDAVVLCYDAILLTLTDGFVTQQFDPSQTPVAARTGANSPYEVEYADGSVVALDELPEDPAASIAEMQRAFEDTLRKMSHVADMFGSR